MIPAIALAFTLATGAVPAQSSDATPPAEAAEAPATEAPAILRLEKNSKGGIVGGIRRLGIHAIDDKAMGSDFRPIKWEGEFPLAPGKHTIEFLAQVSTDVACTAVWLVAEPGKTYRVDGKATFRHTGSETDRRIGAGLAHGHTTVRIVDAETGAPVGGLVGSSDEPDPESTPPKLDNRGCRILDK